MIRKLKGLGARAVLLFVIAAGIGFGILVAGMAAVLGGLVMIGVRLANGADESATTTAAEPAPTDQASAGQASAAQPA